MKRVRPHTSESIREDSFLERSRGTVNLLLQTNMNIDKNLIYNLTVEARNHEEIRTEILHEPSVGRMSEGIHKVRRRYMRAVYERRSDHAGRNCTP